LIKLCHSIYIACFTPFVAGRKRRKSRAACFSTPAARPFSGVGADGSVGATEKCPLLALSDAAFKNASSCSRVSRDRGSPARSSCSNRGGNSKNSLVKSGALVKRL